MDEPLGRRRRARPRQRNAYGNTSGMQERTRIEVEQPMTPYGADVARWAQEPVAAVADVWRATPSWHDAIVEEAASIDEVLLASPSFRRELPAFIAYVYPRAAKEIGMPLSTFPKAPTRGGNGVRGRAGRRTRQKRTRSRLKA